jgi:hypothetical protein
MSKASHGATTQPPVDMFGNQRVSPKVHRYAERANQERTYGPVEVGVTL